MINWKKTARGGALLLLENVLNEGAYSNLALNQLLNTGGYSDKDKNLMTELVYGTVARKITLEWYLAHFIEDRNQLQNWVYDLLLLSLYQILYLDKIPAHAVVNEAVEIAKERGRYTGVDKLVNAVLRRLSSEDLPKIEEIKRKNKRYSIQYSLPVWLVKKMMEQFGSERAVRIFESLFARNKASIRVTHPDKLTEIMNETNSQRSLLSPVGLVKDSGHFAASSYFKSGDITIQDESSQLVAPTLAIAGDEEILDACSAPGGKTTHIAAYLKNGHITALDLYDHKLKLVEENAKRLGLSDKITTKKLDATKVHEVFAADSFDKILVDAPCSGIGLIRRKPDIKYRKEIKDFEQLQKIQLNILDSVCQTLRKGGIITYSTCTIFDEENKQVIRTFLANHPNFVQVKLNHAQTDIVQDGCLVITPEQYQTDGFFIAQLKRLD